MIVRWETPLPIDIYDFFSILRVPCQRVVQTGGTAGAGQWHSQHLPANTLSINRDRNQRG
jgi:hypothetical protein